MAEQQVRAANAEIGVAVGDFFPRIGLTSLYGGTSTDLSNLVSTGANIWSLPASAAGPLFTGGRLDGALPSDQSRLRRSEASVPADSS